MSCDCLRIQNNIPPNTLQSNIHNDLRFIIFIIRHSSISSATKSKPTNKARTFLIFMKTVSDLHGHPFPQHQYPRNIHLTLFSWAFHKLSFRRPTLNRKHSRWLRNIIRTRIHIFLSSHPDFSRCKNTYKAKQKPT